MQSGNVQKKNVFSPLGHKERCDVVKERLIKLDNHSDIIDRD